MNIALLSGLHPADLETGSAVDVASLLEDVGAGALLEIVDLKGAGLAGRILHPAPEGDLVGLLASASPATLESHGITEPALAALLAGSPEHFVAVRRETLGSKLEEQRTRLAEPNASDRPAISNLMIDD
jgi:hypothetical protein